MNQDLLYKILIGAWCLIFVGVILYMVVRKKIKMLLVNRKWNKKYPKESSDEVMYTTNV